MKKLKFCPNCGRKLSGTGEDEDKSINELFCYFCEGQVENFLKKFSSKNPKKRKI